MKISRMSDFFYAMRIIKILTTPWKEQKAFKMGIIDEKGNVLKKYKDLKTNEEKDSYTYLHRIIFNIKRFLETFSAGKNWINIATASYLLLREEFKDLNLTEKEWKMIEEEIFNYCSEEIPTNVTGSSVSTDVPRPLSIKDKKKDSDDFDDEEDDEKERKENKENKKVLDKKK